MAMTGGRLLFWTDCFWPTIGGGEIWSRAFLHGLRARGWDIRVIAFDTDLPAITQATVDGIEVLRLPMRTGFSAGNPRLVQDGRAAIKDVVHRLKPQCVQITGLRVETLLAHSLVATDLRIPTLVTFHSEGLAEQIGAGSLIERIVRRADRISVFDQSMAQWIAQHWPDAAGRIERIPHALIRPMTPWHQARGNGVIAFCGRLSAEKGVDLAIAAFARILPRHPEARLVIAGDGSERPALEVLVRDLRIEDAVTFRGWVDHDEVDLILDDCAFAVMPSRLEAFGLYALEAAARGRAVVAAAVGGLPAHVLDGETGLLARPDDIGSLAAAMSALLTDPDRAAKLGAAGRARAGQRGDWQAHLGAHEALLGQMIGGAGATG